MSSPAYRLTMASGDKLYQGGCLCGALRFEAVGDPDYMGHCYCADCRKASGGGFIPFMNFPSKAVSFSGANLTHISKSARGGDTERNFCPVCGSLVFGGQRGVTDSYTVYAGSLDDPTQFEPTLAIFTKGRPAWAMIPAHLITFEASPS